jgi:hypothetical protein
VCKYKVGDYVLVKLLSGRIVEATVEAVVEAVRRGKKASCANPVTTTKPDPDKVV